MGIVPRLHRLLFNASMPVSPADLSTTHWPDSGSEVPLQAVSRLVFASQSRLQGSVLDEMRRIRDHAVHRNGPVGIRVALLHMCGWFVEWIEGPAPGIQSLLERVTLDPRHHGLQVVHRSVGRPRLFKPWIGAIVQTDEDSASFADRVFTLREQHANGRSPEPASVWLRLCSPPAPDMPVTNGWFPRVMLLSARRTLAFDLLHAVASTRQRRPVQRRFAGSADDVPDVASDYLDLADTGPSGLRLIANARKGLAMGMAHAMLPDHAAVALLLDADASHNRRIIERVLSACRQVHHAPAVVGVGADPWLTDDLKTLVERQGMPWVEAPSGSDQTEPLDLWSALEPVLARLT